MGWIKNRQDGVRFVQSYLNRYAEIQERTAVTVPALLGYLQENDVINIKNTGIGINGDFVIKSIKWNYPEMNTELTVGEYFFDFFEDDQEIVRKLHDFEGAITTSKEIQDYESPEELLQLVTTTGVAVQDSHTFSETLNIARTVNIYDKSRATWGSSKYGSTGTGDASQDVYGSGA